MTRSPGAKSSSAPMESGVTSVIVIPRRRICVTAGVTANSYIQLIQKEISDFRAVGAIAQYSKRLYSKRFVRAVAASFRGLARSLTSQPIGHSFGAISYHKQNQETRNRESPLIDLVCELL